MNRYCMSLTLLVVCCMQTEILEVGKSQAALLSREIHGGKLVVYGGVKEKKNKLLFEYMWHYRVAGEKILEGDGRFGIDVPNSGPLEEHELNIGPWEFRYSVALDGSFTIDFSLEGRVNLGDLGVTPFYDILSTRIKLKRGARNGGNNDELSDFIRYCDAAVQWPTHVFYFKGDHYIRVEKKGWPDNTTEEGYPKRITNSNWDGWGEMGFADGIDAAVAWGDWAYFFRDDEYIKVRRQDFPNNKLKGGKQKISYGWLGFEQAGFGRDIDAAVGWDGCAYFFKGNKYLKVHLGGDSDKHIWPSYPKAIKDSNWPGWQDADFGVRIDAAVNCGPTVGRAYFILGNEYLGVVNLPHPQNVFADDQLYPKPNSRLFHR